jgi:hypothetical protein
MSATTIQPLLNEARHHDVAVVLGVGLQGDQLLGADKRFDDKIR